jgi:hypothetical protein
MTTDPVKLAKELPFLTAEYTAALIILMRRVETDDEAWAMALEHAMKSVTSVLANIVLELDRNGVGEQFLAELPETMNLQLRKYVDLLRDVRSRFIEEKGTVN